MAGWALMAAEQYGASRISRAGSGAMTRFLAVAVGACAVAYIVGVRLESGWLGGLCGCLALVLLGWLGNVKDEVPEEPRPVSRRTDLLVLSLPLATWILTDDVLPAGEAAVLTTASVATYAAFRLRTRVDPDL